MMTTQTVTNHPSTALLTDCYEFTMFSSLFEEGKHNSHAVCELFTRKLPKGRAFGLSAGLGRILAGLKDWKLTVEDIEWMLAQQALTHKAADFLRGRAGKPLFNGTIRAYPEGELYFPQSPIIQVEGELWECLLLETYLLSIMNHDSAVASAAARMTLAARGVPIIEMGSRRTDKQAAVSAARAAYIAGFSSTSNLAAGRQYGIPVKGTSAHAFTLAHESEEEAFLAQMRAWGTETTLLVDTYDTHTGIKRAVSAAQQLGATGPGAIRIDSGDLLTETHQARTLLDSMGATETRIVVSSDLDEYLMNELSVSFIDGYGAGTRVVTGSGHPTAGMVYKLVEIDGRPVEKSAHGKASSGGAKIPFRIGNQEHFVLRSDRICPPDNAVPLYQTFVVNGEVIVDPSLNDSRMFAAIRIEELPERAKSVLHNEPLTTATRFTK